MAHEIEPPEIEFSADWRNKTTQAIISTGSKEGNRCIIQIHLRVCAEEKWTESLQIYFHLPDHNTTNK